MKNVDRKWMWLLENKLNRKEGENGNLENLLRTYLTEAVRNAEEELLN